MTRFDSADRDQDRHSEAQYQRIYVNGVDPLFSGEITGELMRRVLLI